MRLLLIFSAAAILALSLSAAGLAGTWKGSMDTQMGQAEVAITFQPTAALAGTVKLGEYEVAIERAKLESGNIAFEVNIAPGKIVFAGTVSGDEMKLNVTGTQGDRYSLVCKRQ